MLHSVFFVQRCNYFFFNCFEDKINNSVFTAANQLLLNIISVRQVAFGGFQSDVSLVSPKMKNFFHIHILYICSFLCVDFFFTCRVTCVGTTASQPARHQQQSFK